MIDRSRASFVSRLKHYLRHPLLRQDLIAGVAYLLPSAMALLFFLIIPVVTAFLLSFSRWEVLSTRDCLGGY